MNTLQESKISSPRKSKTLRVAFICTTVSGVAKYRMGNFSWEMRKWPNVETVLWPYSSAVTIQNPWQVDMLTDPEVIWGKGHLDYLCAIADVVVWQALDFEHSLDVFMGMKQRHQKPFLMEIDDYIADIPTNSEAYQQYKAGSTRFQVAMSQMRMSDGLIVSTPYLAEQYKEFCNKPIHVVPNSIDFNEWKGITPKKHDRIRIGWIGGGTHGPDLEMVAPVLEEVLNKYEDVWFYCIHGCPEIYKSWPKVYHTLKWAPINRYPRHLAAYGFDIGIAPLVDNNFNRGKSNLRWLEYSALKIPTVASALPDFTRAISSGHDGFIANDLDDWRKYLELLIESADARKGIGTNAYNTIKRKFNARKTSNEYLRILKEYVL
jgi:glycosyltransferase involved in cell wall biosynthesis